MDNPKLRHISLALFFLCLFLILRFHATVTRQQLQQRWSSASPLFLRKEPSSQRSLSEKPKFQSNQIEYNPNLLNGLTYNVILDNFVLVNMSVWVNALYQLLQLTSTDLTRATPVDELRQSTWFNSLVGTKLGRRCTLREPCKLVIATSIFMEEPYLEEWIYYHLLMGVDHFFLVQMIHLEVDSQESEKATQRVLQKFIDRGVVTLSWYLSFGPPALLEQIYAMSLAFSRFHRYSEWMVNVDADEFYFSWKYPYLKYLVSPNFLASIQGAHAIDVIPIPWYLFGSSGHHQRPQGSTIMNYFRRSQRLLFEGQNSSLNYGRLHGKFLFRVRCFRRLFNPHYMQLWPNCYMLSPDWWKNNQSKQEEWCPFHIKHYQTKSLQDWLWKRYASGFTGVRSKEVREDGLPGGLWNSLNRNWIHDWVQTDHQFNDTSDFDMKVYWPIMQAIVGNNNISEVTAWCHRIQKQFNLTEYRSKLGAMVEDIQEYPTGIPHSCL